MRRLLAGATVVSLVAIGCRPIIRELPPPTPGTLVSARRVREVADSLPDALFVLHGVIRRREVLDSIPVDEIVSLEVQRASSNGLYALVVDRCGHREYFTNARGRRIEHRSAPCPWVAPTAAR